MFQIIVLETLSKISAVSSKLEDFSHRTHDAVRDFYLFVQIIEKSLAYIRGVRLSILKKSLGGTIIPGGTFIMVSRVNALKQFEIESYENDEAFEVFQKNRCPCIILIT